MTMQIKCGRGWLPGAVALWVGAVAVGMALLISHAKTPGPAGVPWDDWPEMTKLHHTEGVAKLVVFLHPECPCSRATVAELGRILAKNPRPIEVTACLAQWESGPAEGPLWRAVRSIAGVRVVADEEGLMARRFGAATSGTAALYDERGRLVFFGGITGARGHEGDNAGEDALVRLLQGQSGGNTRSDVYGCSIF